MNNCEKTFRFCKNIFKHLSFLLLAKVTENYYKYKESHQLAIITKHINFY